MTRDQREYWATFSIYDYRTPRFRQALVLFDKVVVPIPDAPIKGSRGEITDADLDRLSAEIDYLEQSGAAVGFTWNRGEFEQWREARGAEGMAQLLDRDRELATRLHVQEAVQRAMADRHLVTGTGHDAQSLANATVIPVYAGVSDYQASWGPNAVDTQVVEIVAEQLPMPDDNEDLGLIVALRQRDSFRAFMPAFRLWQEQVALRLARAGADLELRRRELRVASLELRAAIDRFTRAVQDARFEKVRKGVTLPLLVGAAVAGEAHGLAATLAEEGPELFNVRDLLRPWWRPLQDREFALAGVICEAARR